MYSGMKWSERPGFPALTTFGQSDCVNNFYLEIKDLIPVFDGQLILAKSGQGRWLFRSINQPPPEVVRMSGLCS
jgi:hypothetical protein